MQLGSARQMLDADFMARCIGELPMLRGQPLCAIEFAGIWVKPGRHFNVCYQVTADERRALRVSAFLLAPQQAARIVSSAGAHRAGNRALEECPHCRCHITDDGLILQVFPSDYRLPTLAACFDVVSVSARADTASPFVRCVSAGYRPGMRCQIHYQAADGTSMYGKVAVERSPGQTATQHERVYAALMPRSRRIQLAQPRGYIPDLQLTLVAAAPGHSLHDLLCGRRDVEVDMRALAEALEEFHRLDISGVERAYGITDEIELVRAWVACVAEVYPELSEELHAGEAALLRTPPDRLPPRALVHRDFYDKQILLSPDCVTLLDMDTVCRGDPEIDLGNFCAHLRVRGVQRGLERQCRAWEEAFLAAYPERVVAERVEWYRSSSLLRLACVYALRPRWHQLAPRLLAESRSV